MASSFPPTWSIAPSATPSPTHAIQMSKMFDFSIYGALQPFPYDRAALQRIESARKRLDGSLFIDRVLKALNLSQVASNYPPRDEDALQQLHEQVCQSKDITVHHKLSVIYYLLLDLDVRGLRKDGKDADSFASRAGMPPKYQTFMKGLRRMDSLDFRIALEYLTHPSLIPEFADDIITVLVRNTEDGDYTLPLAYYHTVQPNIQSSAALDLLFDALARSNVTEAFEFSRSHADVMRRQLFQKLVLCVLASARDDETAERAFELASLPFDADEERWFRECLESGEGKRLKIAKDSLLVRNIATGRTRVGGENGAWGVILEGFKTGSGGRTLS